MAELYQMSLQSLVAFPCILLEEEEEEGKKDEFVFIVVRFTAFKIYTASRPLLASSFGLVGMQPRQVVYAGSDTEKSNQLTYMNEWPGHSVVFLDFVSLRPYQMYEVTGQYQIYKATESSPLRVMFCTKMSHVAINLLLKRICNLFFYYYYNHKSNHGGGCALIM